MDKMNQFLEWWHNTVKGAYMTNSQFDAIAQKFEEEEEEIYANV